MDDLVQDANQDVMQLIAKELLEYRLGIEATHENVSRLAACIVQFESELRLLALNKSDVINF